MTAISPPVLHRNRDVVSQTHPAPPEFAEHFRRLVAPRLCEMAGRHWVLVAIADELFSEAHEAIMREACRLGAAFLPAYWLEDLQDQISTWLLDAVVTAEAQWTEARANRIAQQTDNHIRALAQRRT